MQSLGSDIQNKIDQWLNGSYDDQTKETIREKLDEEKYDELSDAFYKEMEFGTGGIRGIMGVGPNRVNKYTLGKATQGLSNFLKKNYPGEEIKVAIAHDCRNHSESLAQVVADVFSANGIHVYLFDGLRPTPELSFAIRELNCHGGVMLTASHNTKEYNGYKAYSAYGGQLVSPQDQQVMEEFQKIDDIDEVQFEGDDERIEKIGQEIDEKYLQAIIGFSVSQDAIQRQNNLKIVFSPLHGTAGVLGPPALERFGFEHVMPVEEQMLYNGDFPTVEKPNPEEKEAISMALDKARVTDAELVMVTDPDADRVGIAVKKDQDGEDEQDAWQLLNGNQTGTLLIHYLLTVWNDRGKLSDNVYIVKTIVTTYLIDRIAKAYGVKCYNTLTGFKYIGELITRLEGEEQFIAGAEESYGYLIGDHVRDKDAIVSIAMIAEMAAYYKDQGSSLYEALLDIYVEYGCFREKLTSLQKQGQEGSKEIKKILKDFRENPPEKLGGSLVVKIKDYKTQEATNVKTGETTSIDLPTSNVIQFITEDDSIASIRPSGTEPKIKFYCSVNSDLDGTEDFDSTANQLDDKLDDIIGELTGNNK
jgi:phosphoglucomutase